MGRPILAYSKKPNLRPVSCSRMPWAMRLPGAPISERLPPIAAAKTSGIRRRGRAKPALAAMPTTTGMRMAAVPVLERKPDMMPVMVMMAMMSCRSVLAKRVTRAPMRFAMPVSKSAPPTMNMATKRMTFGSTKPWKAVLASRTPVTTRPMQTVMAVTASGIFSQTNMMMAKSRNRRVMVLAFMVHLWWGRWVGGGAAPVRAGQLPVGSGDVFKWMGFVGGKNG